MLFSILTSCLRQNATSESGTFTQMDVIKERGTGKMQDSDGNFDAVAMKQRAARRVHKQLASVDEAGRLSYWQKRTEALRKRQSEPGGASKKNSHR